MIVQEKVGAATMRLWSGGTGAPLLYLHGFEHHPGAASFLERLADGRHVHAPEHPGFGVSEGFVEIVDIVDIVLHYRKLMETVAIGPVDIVGHSLGGMFAAEIAALCPHLVRKLVLVNPYGLWLDSVPLPDPFAMTKADLRRAKWADPDGWADREPSAFVAGGADSFDEFRLQNLGAATKFMWPIADRGLARRLPFIAAPTLILHGAQDRLVPPAYAEAFRALIPHATVGRIDGAGHLPMVEAEDRFVAAVTGFLDR